MLELVGNVVLLSPTTLLSLSIAFLFQKKSSKNRLIRPFIPQRPTKRGVPPNTSSKPSPASSGDESIKITAANKKKAEAKLAEQKAAEKAAEEEAKAKAKALLREAFALPKPAEAKPATPKPTPPKAAAPKKKTKPYRSHI